MKRGKAKKVKNNALRDGSFVGVSSCLKAVLNVLNVSFERHRAEHLRIFVTKGTEHFCLTHFRAVFQLGKDEASGGRLQSAGNNHRRRFAKMCAGVIDYDHCAIG
jgi:hypothetical protein